jgi:PAS domain S-box-containing protein
MNNHPSRHALTIVFIYAALSAIWILFSDRLVEMVADSPNRFALISTFKDWLFILATSMLLYWLIKRIQAAGTVRQESKAREIRSIWLPTALMALFVIPLTVNLVYSNIKEKKTSEIKRLQAIADLKVEHVTNWLYERQQDLHYIQHDQALSTAFRHWRQSNDQNAFSQLIGQLKEIDHIGQFEGVNLLDSKGVDLWKSDLMHAPIETIPTGTVLRLAKSGDVQRYGPYRDDHGNAHLDFVIPFSSDSQELEFILVLHMDPSSNLLSVISEWPVPTKSGEVVLFRRHGKEIEFLNNLKHARDAALKLRWPLNDQQLLAAQVARGDWAASHIIEGKDYRNEPVFGVGRSIPGTDWFLLTKMDWSEVYAEAYQNALWVGLSGLMALFMGIFGLHLLRQRQQLALANATSQAQAERIHALNLLSTIADSSTDAIFAKDREGRYLFFNRQAELFSAKTRDQVLGNDDRLLFPPDLADTIMTDDRMLIEQDRISTSYKQLDTPLGQLTFLSTKGPLKDENGEIFGLFGVVRDITEMHQMEEELRQKESRLHALFQTLPDLIWLKDRDGAYLACNPTFERFFGASESQILGQTDYDFLDRDQADLFRSNDRAVIEAGESISSTEWITFADDGHRVLLLTTKTPFFDAAGALIGVLGIGRDITSLHRTEVALRESMEHFRLFYEHAPIAYESLDRNGNILDVNPAWLELLGFGNDDRERVIGKPITDFIVPGQRPLLESRFVEFLTSGQVQGKEYDLIRRDGQIVTVSVDGRTGHDSHGAFLQTHCVLHDITESKRHEKYIRFQARRASILLKLPQIAEDLDETAFIHHGLALIEELTESPLSFVHSVDHENRTIKRIAWSQRIQEAHHQALADRDCPIDEAGILADAFLRREPVVFNDAQDDARRQMPGDTQLTLSRLLSLPVIENERVVMLVGVANKASDYTDLDVETVQLILNEIWHIVQRRRNIDALKQSEEKYRLLVENQTDLVVKTDSLGRIEFVSPSFCNMFGRHEDELLGNKFMPLVHEDDQARTQEVLQQLNHPPYSAYLELRAMTSSGWRWLGWMVNAVPDEREKVSAVIGVGRDITERIETMEALRASEERYRAVVEDTPVLICSFLPVGEITFANKAYCDYFQSSPDKLTGSNFFAFIPIHDRDRVMSHLSSLTPDRPTQSDEFQVITNTGKTRWQRWTNRALFNAQGKAVGYQTIGQDITERKLAEIKVSRLNNELEARVNERTKELELANKELESFVYSVSHDLRAPLRAVTGFAHILVERHLDCLNKEGQHYLDNVLKAGNHMGELIDDLLQYSRTGRGSMQMRPIELAPIIEGLQVTFAERMEKCNARLIIENPLATPLGDATLIGQQFSNLIDNALTYRHPETAPEIHIASKRRNNRVFITVSDNGIGIAPEYHEKIFDVFQRLHSQDEYPGTGVGLAIVAKAARMMDGEVRVESSPGLGSRFSIILPVAEVH